MRREVFICSAGHSGSTLLDMMLGSHPKVESTGELIHLPMDMALNRPCACGSPMQECSVWPDVMRHMGVDPRNDPYGLNLGYVTAKVGDSKRTSLWHQFWTRPKNALKYLELRYGIGLLDSLLPNFRTGTANTLAIYDHLRHRTGKAVVVDSSKHYLRAAALYLARPQSTRIVLLVRDGRGVFFSGLKRGFGRHYSLRAWNRHYRRALALLERHVPAEHRIVVHYEDLVSNPAAELQRLCDFIGIEFSPGMLTPGAVVHHNVNGNDMKFSDVKNLKLDMGWKTQMAPGDLAYFERKAGRLNRQFGYQ